jgi:hypothetical protein
MHLDGCGHGGVRPGAPEIVQYALQVASDDVSHSIWKSLTRASSICSHSDEARPAAE